MASPRSLLGSAACVVVVSTAACQGDYDLDKATPGTLGSPLQLEVRNAPANALLLLMPSWATYFILERDEFDTGHPLYYHIPDLTENPPAVVFNLLVTPLVNTQTDNGQWDYWSLKEKPPASFPKIAWPGRRNALTDTR